MVDLFEKLKQLPPDQRLKALDELEEQLHDLVVKRRDEIKQCERDITAAEDMIQRAKMELGSIEAAQVIPQKIEEMVKPVEKKKVDNKQETLEEIAAREAQTKKAEELSKKPVEYLTNQLQTIYSEIKQTGIETQEQRDRVYSISSAMYHKEKAIERGDYRMDDNHRELFASAQNLMSHLRPYSDDDKKYH